MRSGLTATLVLCSCAGAAELAMAHVVKQRVGAYADSQGLSRQRIGYDIAVDGGASSSVPDLSDSTVSMSATMDRFRSSAEPTKYEEDVYGSTTRLSRTASLGATQTWDRVTETRVLGSFSTDGVVKSRSVAAGVGQWFNRETVRFSLDVSRTIVEQPLFQVLDYDFVEVGNPPHTTATGITSGLRHLATPTTMVDYQLGHVVMENRPATYSGGVSLRQFVPPADGALHAGVARALNRGTITAETTFGQVDAWIADASWLQHLWRGGLAKLGYRYYREDETTRAYEDKKVLGTDMITAGLAHEFKRERSWLKPPPWTSQAHVILTNANVAATSVELGIGARF